MRKYIEAGERIFGAKLEQEQAEIVKAITNADIDKINQLKNNLLSPYNTLMTDGKKQSVLSLACITEKADVIRAVFYALVDACKEKGLSADHAYKLVFGEWMAQEKEIAKSDTMIAATSTALRTKHNITPFDANLLDKATSFRNHNFALIARIPARELYELAAEHGKISIIEKMADKYALYEKTNDVDKIRGKCVCDKARVILASKVLALILPERSCTEYNKNWKQAVESAVRNSSILEKRDWEMIKKAVDTKITMMKKAQLIISKDLEKVQHLISKKAKDN